MVKTTEYNYAVDRLKTLSKLNPVADSGVEREREVLSELIARYEAEHDAEVQEQCGWPGDGSGEDDFADYNQNEGNDW